MTPYALLHMHDQNKFLFYYLHNSAGMRISVGDSQSSRRRARGSSIASKASDPNDTELCLAKQTPFLHWQSLTFAVCLLPKPCRSVMSMGTLCIPIWSALICVNVAAVSGEDTCTESMKRQTCVPLKKQHNTSLCRTLETWQELVFIQMVLTYIKRIIYIKIFRTITDCQPKYLNSSQEIVIITNITFPPAHFFWCP